MSTATSLQREARRQFIREAAKHHPDRGGSVEEFVAARSAYEERKKYDCIADLSVIGAATAFMALIASHLSPVTIAVGLLALAIVLDTPASATACADRSPSGCLPEGPTDFFDDVKRWFEQTFGMHG